MVTGHGRQNLKDDIMSDDTGNWLWALGTIAVLLMVVGVLMGGPALMLLSIMIGG